MRYRLFEGKVGENEYMIEIHVDKRIFFGDAETYVKAPTGETNKASTKEELLYLLFSQVEGIASVKISPFSLEIHIGEMFDREAIRKQALKFLKHSLDPLGKLKLEENW